MIDYAMWKEAMLNAVAASLLEEAEAKKKEADKNIPPAMRRPRRQAIELGPTPTLLEVMPDGKRFERDTHNMEHAPEGDALKGVLEHHARHIVANARQRKAKGLVIEEPQAKSITVFLVF